MSIRTRSRYHITVAPAPLPFPPPARFHLQENDSSGGAIYARDPFQRLDEEQLNGGQFTDMTEADWTTILPQLQENERLFNISVDRLLTVDGMRRAPIEVYRKVEPVELSVL